MRSLFLIMILLSCAFKLHTQDTAHISLVELLQQVEANFPSIMQYQYNIQSIQAKADGAKAWMPPTISTGIMRFPYNLAMVNEKNNPMNQAGIALSVEQMIPNSSKLNAKKSYINSLAEIEISKSEWTKNELRREAKILYYTRYVTEKKQRVLQESEEILQLLISSSEEKYSNNQAQLPTIFKAKARLAELRNMILMLDGIIAESNIGLNSLIVRDVDTPFEIDTLIEPVNYSVNMVDTTSISSRSDVIALTNYIQAMKLEQRVMKIGARPDFGIRVEHALMFGMPDQWSIMGMMTIPIVPWASKMYSSEVKSIGFQIQAMEREKQTMELMATRMLSEKMAMLTYETAQYRSFNKNIIPAYESNLQVNLLAYKNNTGDFFVLLDAWEMLLMKKLEMYDLLLNTLKLEAEYQYEGEIR